MSIFSEHGSGPVDWKKNLAVLWFGVFLACASYTSCIPFLPVYLMKELHVGDAEINFWSGLVFSATFLSSSVMAPYWGAWADRVGQRKMAIRAGIGLSITYLLGGVVQSAPQMLAVRFVTGLISGFVPASMSLVSSTLPREKMGWGLGFMQTAVSSGTILGPLLGAYLSAWFGMRMSFFMGAASLFCAAVLVILFVRDIPISAKMRRSQMHVLEDVKHAFSNPGLVFVMAAFFAVQTCTMIAQPLITLYTGDLMGGQSEASVKMSGWIFSLVGIAGIIAAPFWGARGQKRGFAKILALVLCCAGLVQLCQILVGSVYQFAIVQFIYGLFLAGAVPNVNSILVEVTPLEMRGKAFGLSTSAQQFGGVAGPLIGGFLGSLMPTPRVFFSIGVILILAALYTYRTRVRGKTGDLK